MAPRDIPPGVEWGEGILCGIESCRVMVLVFSKHANESPQVRREVERAVGKGLVIVPFRIENVLPTKAMEYFISAAHWLDAFTPPLQKQLEDLAGTLSGILGQPGVKPAPVRGPSPRGRYTVKECTVLFTTAGVFATLLFGGLYWLSKNGKDSPPDASASEKSAEIVKSVEAAPSPERPSVARSEPTMSSEKMKSRGGENSPGVVSPTVPSSVKSLDPTPAKPPPALPAAAGMEGTKAGELRPNVGRTS